MNTNRSGLSAGCRARQASRAAATRRAGSFFARQPARQEEAPQRRAARGDAARGQTDAELFERQVRRRGHQGEYPVGMGRQHRRLPATVLVRLDGAAPAPALHQLDHEADADREPGRRRPTRSASLDRGDHPLPQIHRVRLCHPSLASSTQRSV
jgi:hypothetical protein